MKKKNKKNQILKCFLIIFLFKIKLKISFCRNFSELLKFFILKIALKNLQRYFITFFKYRKKNWNKIYYIQLTIYFYNKPAFSKLDEKSKVQTGFSQHWETFLKILIVV